LKWVGGKTQIIDSIIEKIPKVMDNYHEIFLGGGSVLLAVLSLQEQKEITIKGKIYAYDINESLINLYKHVQDNKDELHTLICEYFNTYDEIEGKSINRNPTSIEEAKTSKESYYYWIRKRYNKSDCKTAEHAAMFYYLNKTCFRGIYREGPNGYNVPYGHYKKTPTFISKEELSDISNLIRNVEFIYSDCEKSMKYAKEGDFVYLDPPYAKENSKSFVGYVSDGFDEKKQQSLFDDIKKLKSRFVMSNANTQLIADNFSKYNRKKIVAKRAINSRNPGSKTYEVIMYN
jgi:DNA adenine methylase